MVKLLFLCRRRPDISHERYVELLLRGHVPLALRHHPTLRRYVVNVVEASEGAAPPLDSIGALWFDSLADYRERLYDSPEGQRIIGRDVAGFMGGAGAYVTTEHVQRAPAGAPRLGERSAGVKTIICVRRGPGQTHPAFVSAWLERHVPLALRHHGMHTYVTNVVDACLADAPPYDGIGEIAFASEAERAERLYTSPAGRAAIEDDLRGFRGAFDRYQVAEYVQRW